MHYKKEKEIIKIYLVPAETMPQIEENKFLLSKFFWVLCARMSMNQQQQEQMIEKG